MSNESDFIIENGILTQYTGSGGIVEIPECVTEIGEYVFSEASKITKVIFPQGLTKIGRESFSKCRKLEEVIFPQSLKEIGSKAFYLCRKLKSVEIPGSCESTGSFAFWGCSGLETLVMNEGINEVGYCSFADCSSLSQIHWPTSLKTIWQEAFSKCKSLTEVILPDGVEQVYPSAFGDCTSVGKVILSKNVLDSIDAKWFRSRFNNVDLNFLWLNNQTNFDSRIGALCAKSILRKKDDYAALIISKNDTQAMSTFLTLLGKVSAETLDRYIAACGEANATEICAILINYKNKKFTTADIAQIAEEQIEKEFGIRDYTVADWRNIFRFSNVEGKVIISAYKGHDTEITIPAKIGKAPVGSVCISHYQNRKHLNVEVCEKITKVTIEHGVEHIGRSAFSHCTALEEVIIPSSVRTIGDYAFRECSSLQSIVIPEGVTEVGSAFWHCNKLVSITMPGSVTAIGWTAFSDSPNLIIHAPAGSYAEAYAKENNIPFVAE